MPHAPYLTPLPVAQWQSMLTILSFILATAFPSTSKTTWMRPESFHLIVGMSRADAVARIEQGGWKTQKGDKPAQLIVDYTPTQSLTLEFEKDRLRSIRFELFTPIREIGKAFDEEKEYLRKQFGEPKAVAAKNTLIYDSMLPNVMAVLTADPKTEPGRKGLGLLVVRYYDPVPPK